MTNKKQTEEQALKADSQCFRSGLFLLALSSVAAMLIPSWRAERRYLELGRYVIQRHELKAALERLDIDPCWNRYKAADNNVEERTLRQLRQLQCDGQQPFLSQGTGEVDDGPLLHFRVDPPQATKDAPKSDTSPPASEPSSNSSDNLTPTQASAASQIVTPPPAPTMIAVTQNIGEIVTIIKCMVGDLNNEQLLSESRAAHGVFDLSIYRWVRMRDKIIRNKSTTVVITLDRSEERPQHFVGSKPANEILDCITLADVRRLSQYEFPSLKGEVVVAPPGAPDIDLQPGAIPKGLFAATLFIEVLLLVTLIYFSSYLRLFLSCGAPPRASLVGVFSQTNWLAWAFLLLALVPGSCSVLLALYSRDVAIMALALLGVFVNAYVVWLVIQRHEFAGALTSRMVKSRDASGQDR